MTSPSGHDPGLEMLAPYFEGYGEPDEIWEGEVAKKARREAYAAWLGTLAPWKVFVTLTFAKDRPVDSAKSFFRRLIRELNRDLFGKRYSRVVGHSYFSYVLASEYQKRGAIHFHFLADRPLNFRLLHDQWNAWAGFAQTAILESPTRAVECVVKYVVKNDDIEVYRSGWRGEPIARPSWWDWACGEADWLAVGSG